MPPKKRIKDDLPSGSAVSAVRSLKKSKAKSKGTSSVPEPSSSIKTRSKTRTPASTFIEAAEGAGIYSTDELRAIKESNATIAMHSDGVQLSPDSDDLNELAPEPELETEEKADSTSESEGELTDSDANQDDSTPLQREISYDRDQQRFTEMQISPGSMRDGNDTRDLEKLQEILNSNPDALNTLDSMLKALKSSKPSDVTQSKKTKQSRKRPRATSKPPRDNPPASTSAGNINHLINQTSETTIYTNAVPSESPSQQRPLSGTAVQNMPPPMMALPLNADDSEIIFADRRGQLPESVPAQINQPDPDPLQLQREARSAAKGRTDQVILDAQRQRIELARPSAGISDNRNLPEVNGVDLGNSAPRAALLQQPGSYDLTCDDKLFQLTAHVDDITLRMIQNGEYVEFSKLLPREKVVPAQDKGKFQIVDDDGKPAFSQYVPKDLYSISNFKKWELAFDIFAKIYSDSYPLRAPELLEYKHIIRRGAESFPWVHVYNYDQIFRQFVEKNPGRTWAKKHLETWTNHVTDPRPTGQGNSLDRPDNRKTKPPCKFFNKNGNCKRGRSCDHDHRCSFCGLFGHGRYNCFKLQKKTAAPSTATATSTPTPSVSSTSQ